MYRFLMSLILLSLPLKALVVEPAGCLKSDVKICLVKTQKKSEVVQWKSALVWLGKESMVELSHGGLRVLQGHVWLQAREEMPFQSPFVAGTIKGDLWLNQDAQKTLIRHLSGELFLRLKTNSKTVEMPVGFENWYAGIQSDKEVYQGVLRAMPATEILGEWMRVFQVPRKLSSAQYEKWSQEWSGNVEVGSEIYQASLKRHIASLEARSRTQAKVQFEHQQESRKLRELYRAKNAMDASGRPIESPNSPE